MKRYFVFYGRRNYPFGGMNDFIGDFEEVEQAKHFQKEIYDKEKEQFGYDDDFVEDVWFQIFDTQEKVLVFNEGNVEYNEYLDKPIT